MSGYFHRVDALPSRREAVGRVGSYRLSDANRGGWRVREGGERGRTP